MGHIDPFLVACCNYSMSNHAKWFIGAALVLLLMKVGLRSKDEATTKNEPGVEQEASAVAKVVEKPSLGSAKEKKVNAAPIIQMADQAKTVQLPKKQVLKIDLSERTINEMEYDWSSLSAQAEAVREIRGWRFTRVNADSPFYRAGLRTGDLITEDFLNALRGQDTAANLAYRIELILNRITR